MDAGPTLQEPVALIVGTTAPDPLSFEAAVTVNVDPIDAEAGAPVRVAVGAAFARVIDEEAFADEYTLLAAQVAFTWHLPAPFVMVTKAVTVVPVAWFAPTVQSADEVDAAAITGTTVSLVEEAVTVKVAP